MRLINKIIKSRSSGLKIRLIWVCEMGGCARWGCTDLIGLLQSNTSVPEGHLDNIVEPESFRENVIVHLSRGSFRWLDWASVANAEACFRG